MTMEYRSFTADAVEATDEGHVFGLAIPYNRVTTIGDMSRGGFREQIAPGSCNKSLREADIVALNNHNSWQPLGRTSAGNLTLTSTTRGIEPDLVPIPTSYGTDLVLNVRAGIVKGWSFGFEVTKQEWQDADGGAADEYTGTDRIIREMKLIEVSPVTFPAYDMTSIGTRSDILEAREALFNGAATRGGNAPGDGSKPYGNVTYADSGLQSDGKKRYPLDTKAHAKAAWGFINQPDNAKAYNSEQLATIKDKIKAALKKFGVQVSDQNEAKLADEWRAKIEARKVEKRAKRLAKRERKETRADDSIQCPSCGISFTVVCPKVGGNNNAHQVALPKAGDPNIFGANHGVDVKNGVDVNSADPSGDTRAAKATYGDLETCGECGSTGQYGKYCSSCGKPMTTAAPSGKFCTACGAKLSGDRAAHVCESRKDDTSDLTSGTKKRIPQIDALLSQALKLIGGADPKSLPDDVKQAIALIASAATHASHLVKHEQLDTTDAVSDNDAGRSAEPKPDESTSENIPNDQALILARLRMISRDVDMGF
jgi:HK97 family phage prohead protease